MGVMTCCDKFRVGGHIHSENDEKWFVYFYVRESYYRVNIKFCPYCGQELSKLKDSKPRENYQ